MAQLHVHAEQLYRDVGKLAETGGREIGQPLADVYNTLLERAKKLVPEDQLIDTLKPVGEAMHPHVLQALVGQLRLVLGNY